MFGDVFSMYRMESVFAKPAFPGAMLVVSSITGTSQSVLMNVDLPWPEDPVVF